MGLLSGARRERSPPFALVPRVSRISWQNVRAPAAAACGADARTNAGADPLLPERSHVARAFEGEADARGFQPLLPSPFGGLGRPSTCNSARASCNRVQLDPPVGSNAPQASGSRARRGRARSGRPHCDRRGVVWWPVRPWRRPTVDSSLRHGASRLAGCQATNPASSACGHRASLARPPGHALPSSAPDSDGSVPGRAASPRDLRGPGGRVRPHGLRIAGVSPTPRDACIARGPRGRARLPGLPRVRHDLRFAPESLRRTVSAFGARLRRRVLAHGFARARCAPRPGSTRRIVWCASEALPSFGRVPVTA